VKWADKVWEPVFGMVTDRLKPRRARSQAEADEIIEAGRTKSRVDRLREEQKVLGLPVMQFIEVLKHLKLPDGSNPAQEELLKLTVSQLKHLISAPADAERPTAPDEPPTPDEPPPRKLKDGKPDEDGEPDDE
jgi:hypothetical protein